MSASNQVHISLEQAKLLVQYLEAGEQDKANNLLAEIQTPHHHELYDEIASLSNQLHKSLDKVQFDPRINDLTQDIIPDAKQRLDFVIKKTEDAANKTLDIAEAIFPITQQLKQQSQALSPLFKQCLENNNNTSTLPEKLSTNIQSVIASTAQASEQIEAMLTDIVMAQDFQDITGQVIRKVIELVINVENSLNEMLSVYASSTPELEQTSTKNKSNANSIIGENLAEGPILDAEKRTDVVSDQDDVDDLLSSLGI